MKTNQNLLIAQVVKFLNERGGCYVWRQENNGRIDENSLVTALSSFFWGFRATPLTGDALSKHIRSIVSKCYRRVPSSIKGVPDVIGFHLSTGLWVSVEVKCGTDEVRPEQRVFLQTLKRAGGEVWIVRDIESFRSAWFRVHATEPCEGARPKPSALPDVRGVGSEARQRPILFGGD